VPYYVIVRTYLIRYLFLKCVLLPFKKMLFNTYHVAVRSIRDDIIDVRLYIDTCSVELLTDKGTVVMTELAFPERPFTWMRVKSEGGVNLDSVKIHSFGPNKNIIPT
jgi:fructan beta-fructosidase